LPSLPHPRYGRAALADAAHVRALRSADIVLTILFIVAAAHGPDVKLGLGVSAPGPNEIVVKVEGRDTRVKLAGVPADSDSARLFLQCLVANRVLRVDAKHGRAWMLDEIEVADHVRRYLDNPGALDPCDAGRAAYVGATDPLPRVQRKKGT
jgi:hypothetical protein